MMLILAAFACAIERQLPQLAVKEGEDPGCVICKQIVIVVEQLVSSQTTQEEIIQVCDFLCQQLPAAYAPLCVNVVTQYIPVICQWIEQGLEAVDICGKLGFCPTQKVEGRSKVTVVRRVRGPACDMCTKMVGYIEDLLKDTTVVEEIVKACDDLCEYQQLISDLCKQLVNTYVPTIIAWLEQGLESLDICTKVGFCSMPSDAVKSKPRAPKVGRTEYCDMCIEVLTHIKEMIDAGSPTVEISIWVAVKCDTYKKPDVRREICKLRISDVILLIVTQLEGGRGIEETCWHIGLCEQPSKDRKSTKIAKQVQGSDYQCTMCETAVSLIENLVKSTTVESEIEAKVKQYCQTLSSPWSTACESMVAQFVPVIIEWIEQGIEALQICVSLGLCEKTGERRPRILKFEVH